MNIIILIDSSRTLYFSRSKYSFCFSMGEKSIMYLTIKKPFQTEERRDITGHILKSQSNNINIYNRVFSPLPLPPKCNYLEMESFLDNFWNKKEIKIKITNYLEDKEKENTLKKTGKVLPFYFTLTCLCLSCTFFPSKPLDSCF